MRDPEDFLEQVLKRAAQREEKQDDIVIYYVMHKGQEVPIIERSSELQFIPDPDGKGEIPITVTHVKYRLDDHGKPFGKMAEVGACKYGCITRSSSLSVCALCGQNICQKHTFFVGKRPYCRKLSICWFVGRTLQLLRLSFRIIRYCFRLVTGLNTGSSTYDSEEKFFIKSSEDLSSRELK